MFYRIKTSILKRNIAEKQKTPFDYEKAENYVLNQNDDDTINNSYYFSAHDFISRESFYCRLGLRNCHNEVWFCYEKGVEKYIYTEMLVPHGSESPLTVQKYNGNWRIKFHGYLSGNDGKKIVADFDGEFHSDGQAVDFFTHMPPIRTAKAMAQEKWSKKYFSEVRANNQVHYEQFGSLNGALRLGNGKKFEFSMPCVRDHSFGKRDWNYMNNHMWLMAVSENEQLNFSMVSYPAMTLLEVGNFKPDGKPMTFMLSADYDRAAVAKGVIPQNFALKLQLDDGNSLNVVTEKISEQVYVFQDGQYNLIEGIANYSINGKRYRGIFEIGANGDSSRIYNGKNTKKIRV